MKQYSSGICCNCGAEIGLHMFGTNNCPRNGMEQSDPNNYLETVFEDSGIQRLRDAAPELLENLIRIIDRIEESELQNQFPSAYARAKAAIDKSTKL